MDLIGTDSWAKFSTTPMIERLSVDLVPYLMNTSQYMSPTVTYSVGEDSVFDGSHDVEEIIQHHDASNDIPMWKLSLYLYLEWFGRY